MIHAHMIHVQEENHLELPSIETGLILTHATAHPGEPHLTVRPSYIRLTWEFIKIVGPRNTEGSQRRLGVLVEKLEIKGLYWEPQTGNPKNIVGI